MIFHVMYFGLNNDKIVNNKIGFDTYSLVVLLLVHQRDLKKLDQCAWRHGGWYCLKAVL